MTYKQELNSFADWINANEPHCHATVRGRTINICVSQEVNLLVVARHLQCAEFKVHAVDAKRHQIDMRKRPERNEQK